MELRTHKQVQHRERFFPSFCWPYGPVRNVATPDKDAFNSWSSSDTSEKKSPVVSFWPTWWKGELQCNIVRRGLYFLKDHIPVDQVGVNPRAEVSWTPPSVWGCVTDLVFKNIHSVHQKALSCWITLWLVRIWGFNSLNSKPVGGLIPPQSPPSHLHGNVNQANRLSTARKPLFSKIQWLEEFRVVKV